MLLFVAISSFLLFFLPNSGARTSPTSSPFDTKKIGETYVFDVKVVDHFAYAVSLHLYISRPSQISHLFDDESIENAVRLREILVGAIPSDEEDSSKPGIPVPAKFLVQIYSASENKLILSELVDHPRSSAAYMGRYMYLAQKELSPGLYTVRVEYLYGAPGLGDLQAEIMFYKMLPGK